MVRLDRIYTKTGDDGTTGLGDGTRLPKHHPRVAAYGTVDELSSVFGLAVASGLDDPYRRYLIEIQNDLFDVGADLSVPETEETRERLRVRPEQTTWLEERCDEVNADLPKLRSFLLPGGTAAAAQLHVCRTVCRRAERRALLVEDANPEVVRYLNRLSDLLFILSRGANAAAGGAEPLWEPGRNQ